MEFATPNHRPSFTGWDNTPDASVTHGGVPSGKLCWVVIKCVAWPILVMLSFLSSLIAVISVALKKHLTTSCFWTIEEESSHTTKWDSLRLRLAMPSSIYHMVPSCRSIESPAVFRILSLDPFLLIGG
jgi:hypothetical protein